MELSWTILFLITKGNAENRWIGIIEVMWKVVEAIIDTRIKTVVTFHNVLHGFSAIRGTWTAITDINMVQELASIYQYQLLLVLLDLWNAYDILYHIQLLSTLEGYGSGPKIKRLLAELWENQEVVTRHNGYHGLQFRAACGTTQG